MQSKCCQRLKAKQGVVLPRNLGSKVVMGVLTHKFMYTFIFYNTYVLKKGAT